MIRIVNLYPDLLGTYGDSGNALVLYERLRRREIATELIEVHHGDEVPPAALYLLGGGEDGPQRMACELLKKADLAGRAMDGSFVFGVCAGLQLLGTTFSVEGNDQFEGLGLIDAVTTRGTERSVGDLVTLVDGRPLLGFENHGGVTTLSSSVSPLGTVAKGRGNNGALDGVRTPRVWATYAHGPVMALNPWFADELLSAVVGEELEPLASIADTLYHHRCRELGL